MDRGHSGMALADFEKHPLAVAAGLDRAMVLALRLYSSPVHVNVNKYLRLGCSAERPHPYPALVTNLIEAILLLRQLRFNVTPEAEPPPPLDSHVVPAAAPVPSSPRAPSAPPRGGATSRPRCRAATDRRRRADCNCTGRGRGAGAKGGRGASVRARRF